MQRAYLRLIYRTWPRFRSRLRKRLVKIKNPHATIRFGANCMLGPGFDLHMPYGGTFIAGDNVEFRRNFRAELSGPDSRLEIGSGCYLTYDVIIACGTTITIGERCGVGQATFIVDGSHRYRDPDTPFLEQGYDYTPIVIEDDVQIHSKCTIINSIGTRSIIGANAVVSKPIPPFSVAVGVPARVIDTYGS